MASITTRNLNDDVKARLHEAVSEETARPLDLVEFTRECFAPAGGVELRLPPRGPMREPPDFS